MTTMPVSCGAFAFEKYICEVMSMSQNFRNVRFGDKVGIDREVNIAAERRGEVGWERLVIEAKYATTFTTESIGIVVTGLVEIQQMITGVKCVFLVTGRLPDQANFLLNENGIEVWDGDYLSTTFKNEMVQVSNPIFSPLFLAKQQYFQKKEHIFIERLRACEPGKGSWTEYKNVVGQVLSHLFCPPLMTPLSEEPNRYKANKRDFIFPNYCEKGFWAFLRSRYSADYVVVDVKNAMNKVTRKEVEETADFLKKHGTGLFGMVVARNGISDGAKFALRDAWELEKKCIIILEDADIEHMLLAKLANIAPETIIRNKIEEFRLTV